MSAKSSVSPIMRFDGDPTQAWNWRHACSGAVASSVQIRRLVATLRNSQQHGHGIAQVPSPSTSPTMSACAASPRRASRRCCVDGQVGVDSDHRARDRRRSTRAIQARNTVQADRPLPDRQPSDRQGCTGVEGVRTRAHGGARPRPRRATVAQFPWRDAGLERGAHHGCR